MAAFQYRTDKAGQDASALKDPDADPLISGNVSSTHDSDFESMAGRAQSDSDTDPELEQEPSSHFNDLFNDMNPSMMSPYQQRPLMPLNYTELHGQLTPSTDSPTSNSPSSVIIDDTLNKSNRKRKSSQSTYSLGHFGSPIEFPGILDQEYQSGWAGPSNSSFEQDTKDTLEGMNGLYMESADASPSSSLTSSFPDNQYGLLGVSIPHFAHQDSSESSDSSPLEMPPSQNQGVSHTYSQDSSYAGANMKKDMVNYEHQPLNFVPDFLPQPSEPSMPFQPHHDPQYNQLTVISAQTVQYAPLKFFVLANRLETRVETALDIRLVLVEPPSNIRRLRMNKTHLYKAKAPAQLDDTSLDSDTVEVRAVVFRASALKNLATQTRDPEKEARAMEYTRAIVEAKEEKSPPLSPGTPSASADTVEPIQTPCKLCIGREMKRLTRGPQTPKTKSKTKLKATDGPQPDTARSNEVDVQRPAKVELEQMNHEVARASRRMVTMQIKAQALVDWQLPPSQNTDSATQLMRAPPAPLPHTDDDDEELDTDGKKKKKLPVPPVDEGTIAVDIALRICCYCRHKNENEGYCVVFTLIDHQRKVVGLAITDPLNINDSHKDKKYKKEDDKNKKAPPPKPVIETHGLPGEGVFRQQPCTPVFQPQLSQSHSAPNLSAGPQYFNFPQIHQTVIYTCPTPPDMNTFPNANYSVPRPMASNRSRAASPSAPTNPAKRQRAQGNDWRVPHNLVMTPIPSEPAPREQHMPNINFHHTNTTNFNNMYDAASGSVNVGLPASAALTNGQPLFDNMMRQVQAGFRTNPSTPQPSSPTFSDRTDYEAAQRPASHTAYRQMSGLHMGAPDPRLQVHGSNINPPVQAPQRFNSNLPNEANYIAPETSTRFEPPGQDRQTLPRPAITYVHPSSGRTDGGVIIHILGRHLNPGLHVYFGNRPATEVTVLGHNGLTCSVPRVNRPCRVPVYLVANGRIVPPHHPYPPLYYSYVDEEDQTGAQGTRVFLEGDYDSQASSEYSGEHMGGISPPQQKQQDQGRMPTWHQQYTQYQSRHGSPLATETPPSYEDATTKEQRDRFNRLRMEKDQKTFSTLQAAGETIADYCATEMFDSPEGQNSKVASSKVETSKMETSRVETSKAVTKARKELSLLEQKREVKGLRSDLKLWAIWIPILIVVLTIMLYTHVPAAWSACLSKVGGAVL